MGTGLVKTLKSIFSKHPPLLVFVTCLLLFGLAAITLAFLVEEKDLPNPDIETDWNTFLTKLAKWNVCRQHAKKSLDIRKQIALFKSSSESVQVPMSISAKWPTFDDSAVLVVSGNIHGPQFEKDHDLLHVTMQFSNADHRNETCTPDSSCTVNVPVCLTFTGSLNMLPNTRKPESCSENFDWIAHKAIFYEAPSNAHTCSRNDLLQIFYVPNPDLTVMLTYRERSLVNIHLKHTGYFVLVVAFTLFFSILLRDHFKSTARSESKIPPEELLLETVHGI